MVGKKKNSPQEDEIAIFLLIDIIETLLKYTGESEVATKSQFQSRPCLCQAESSHANRHGSRRCWSKILILSASAGDLLGLCCEGVRHSVYVRVEG